MSITPVSELSGAETGRPTVLLEESKVNPSLNRRTYLAITASTIAAGGTLSKSRAPDGPSRFDVDAPARIDHPTRRATTRAELRHELEQAVRGDVVWIPPDVTIDLSGIWLLEVPDGVTLASNGQLGGPTGARLDTSDGDESPEGTGGTQKIKLGTGARFSGLQLRGHHHEYVNAGEQYDGDYYAHRGSGIWAGADARVDNCELSGWVHSAVWAVDNAHIHHNYIHHNTWEALGYGVSVYAEGSPSGTSMPLIEHNEFNYNRHAISGVGGSNVGYVARGNVVGPDWVGAQFDMHGDDGMDGVAGDEVVIQDNTFQGTHTIAAKTEDPNVEVPAIHIRGTPVTGVWVEDNRFYHENREGAYQQTGGPHKVQFSDNVYGRPSEQSEDGEGAERGDETATPD